MAKFFSEFTSTSLSELSKANRAMFPSNGQASIVDEFGRLTLPKRPPFFRCAAFSLVELLTVIVILMVTATAIKPALGMLRSSSLTQSGNRLVDLAMMARQTAVSKNTITALIVVFKSTSSSQKLDRQAIAVLEYDALQKTWKKMGPWERLPEAVQVFDYAGGYPYGNASAANEIAPISLALDGQPVDSSQSAYTYTSLVFYPDGRLSGGTGTRTIDLVYAVGSQTENFYKLVFNNDTAAIRIVRP